ncbi:MAG: hypothetical protein LJE88_02820 [Deltaproteobacteria bacterium]|nr:hypothetical protein [Deltaproteobacteria bacterium]MCG6980319.1 hypothetical protein [Deltaproteobacteria bacterium]
MKKRLSFLIVVCTVSLLSVPGFALDLNGIWNVTVTDSITHCAGAGKGKVGDYTIALTQKGDKITIIGQASQTRYVGEAKQGAPNHVHVHSTDNLHGGYVTELVDIDFDNDQTGKGGSVWRWSDGLYQCGGSYKFTLHKIQP